MRRTFHQTPPKSKLSCCLAIMVVLCLIGSAKATYTINDFHSIWPWEYKGDGLYEVDIGINKGTDAANTTLSDGSIVLAVGDIDDNKHNDIITVSDDQKTVTLNYFNTGNSKYGNQKQLKTGNCIVGGADIISNPVYRIALVCTENTSYEYIKLVANDENMTMTDLTDFKLQKGSQPFFIDINSDTFVDIAYNQNTNTLNYDIRVALFNTNSGEFESSTIGLLDTYTVENTTIGCQSIPNKASLKLANPNFSTLADVNSDCVSDLYLTVDTGSNDLKGLLFVATILRADNGSESLRYCLVETDDLASDGLTSPVFADFNRDAAIDKAFYDVDANSINIFYNQRSANSASSSSLCKSMPVISSDTQADYFSDFNVYTGTPDITKLEGVTGLYSHSTVEDFIPGQLRVSDLDSNGFPDLIATFDTTEGRAATHVLINVECNSDESSDCTDRSFDFSNDYERLSEYNNTMYGFLLDFDDNGRMDIVLVAVGDNDTSTLLSFYNNYARDSYYVTASTFTTSESSYGSKVFGVNYRGIYTTLSDSNNAFMATQISRTSFGALESPIATYAIGRSNNYIEDFTLTYPIQKYTDSGAKGQLSTERQTWTPIIPNSHLLIDINKQTASKWNIKLLINPTDSFLLVGIILTLILIIIGGVIIYMHMKEKKEDEESRNPQLDFF